MISSAIVNFYADILNVVIFFHI